jgi:hypothetical protein
MFCIAPNHAARPQRVLLRRDRLTPWKPRHVAVAPTDAVLPAERCRIDGNRDLWFSSRPWENRTKPSSAAAARIAETGILVKNARGILPRGGQRASC